VGVNRFSFGIQSFNDQELAILGRLHKSTEAKEAVLAATNAGFTNINLDLMYGLPNQTLESWTATLEQAIMLSPQHLSLYQLTIEEGTPFQRAVASKAIVLPGEDDILLMDEATQMLLNLAGFNQYEISNYAKPGYECQHNINYWQNLDYLACGASAVSCVDGVREKRIADPQEYVRRITEGCSVIVESESLGPEASFRESVIMGLRMNKGVSLLLLDARYHIDIVKYYGEVLEKLINLQLIELTSSHLRLTEKGRPLANLVMAELV
jgi:oxygen-independent coproporphyrinogen-3 oxidase